MNRLEVTPTKGNLIKLKDEYIFAKEGFKLLDEKKKVIISEILKNIKQAKKLRKIFNREAKYMKELFDKVIIFTGSRNLKTSNLLRMNKYKLNILEKSFMGILYPEIKFEIDLSLNQSVLGTSVYLDEFIIKMRDFSNIMFELIRIEMKVWRLGFELKKLLKRVNALKNIYLPQYSATIKYIEDTLEEIDREEFFLRRVLKNKREKNYE